MANDLRAELREEWLLLQKQYEDFDQRALTIKGWSTPLLGAGYAVGAKEGIPSIIAATMIVAACLWVLETIWKTFQYCHTDRIKALERYFSEPEKNLDFKPYQIFNAWGVVFDRDKFKWGLWTKRAFQPFVAVPYLPMLLAGLVILFALPKQPASAGEPAHAGEMR